MRQIWVDDDDDDNSRRCRRSPIKKGRNLIMKTAEIVLIGVNEIRDLHLQQSIGGNDEGIFQLFHRPPCQI